MSLDIARDNKKRIVIVGGGFGGLKLANRLKRSDSRVVLIDKNNYHRFPPLTYQMTLAGTEPTSISFPFHKMFQHREDFYFRITEVRAILPGKSMIQTSIGETEYNYPVLVAGTTADLFDNKHIEEEAVPMKNVPGATGLRSAFFVNLERAVICSNKQKQQELLNIVVVGGDATRVEVVRVLSEMKKFILPGDYPDMSSSLIRIYLIGAGPRLLAGMPEGSLSHAGQFLCEMGINIPLNERVTNYHDCKVTLEDGSEITTHTSIWVSGATGVSFGNVNTSVIDHGDRIKVDVPNRVEGTDDVFAIGDLYILSGDEDHPSGYPQPAQVATQQGELLVENLIRLGGGEEMKPFHCHNLGSMAAVECNRAVVGFSKVKMQGWFAWVMWLIVHPRSIPGTRDKVMVLLSWVWSYFIYDQSMRMTVRAHKAKEIHDRGAIETTTHWGKDLTQKSQPAKQEP